MIIPLGYFTFLTVQKVAENIAACSVAYCDRIRTIFVEFIHNFLTNYA